MDSHTFSKCPKCLADNIELISVEDHERYNFNINKIGGIEVEFSDERARSR